MSYILLNDTATAEIYTYGHTLSLHDALPISMWLDSDGGSVHGAIALGREIRQLALATTVGRTVDLDGKEGSGSHKRAVLSPRADCESMCAFRSEEHTSELQSLMRISYAVFCLKKQKQQ